MTFLWRCLAALWMCLLGGMTWAAPCETSPSGWQAWRVEPGDVEVGQVLLGRDGSRVTVGTDSIGAPFLESGVMRAPGAWLDRVDWSVYHDANRGRTSPVVYAERDATGQTRACRLERREVTEAFQARQRATSDATPGPADTWVLSQETLSYNAQGQIT